MPDVSSWSRTIAVYWPGGALVEPGNYFETNINPPDLAGSGGVARESQSLPRPDHLVR